MRLTSPYMGARKALAVTLAAIALAAGFGYLGYRLGFLGFIYGLALPQAFASVSLLVLAVVAGIAAFFSPCAFGVLPAYVGHVLTAGKARPGTARIVGQGLLAAAGVITVDIAVGLLIAALGAATPFQPDPRQDPLWLLGIRALAGLVILLLGLTTLGVRLIGFHWLQARFAGLLAAPSRSLYTYGVLYNAAGIGCTGPILLGLSLHAYSSGSFGAALLAFGIFSLIMGALMFAVTLLVGLARRAVVERAGRAVPAIARIAGIVMVAVGLGTIVLNGNDLFIRLFFPFLR
jgi:cytochrome c-type biogenesis protein